MTTGCGKGGREADECEFDACDWCWVLLELLELDELPEYDN